MDEQYSREVRGIFNKMRKMVFDVVWTCAMKT